MSVGFREKRLGTIKYKNPSCFDIVVGWGIAGVWMIFLEQGNVGYDRRVCLFRRGNAFICGDYKCVDGL